MPTRWTRHLATLLWGLALAGLALFVAAWAFRSWLVVTFPFQVEYGEGPVADWVRSVAQGRLPYKPIQPEPWTFSVYTPLYLVAGGALLRLGLPLWAGGRAISLASAVGTAVLVFILAGGGSRRRGLAGAVAGTGLFLASPYLARWATFYRPDMLALFWSALGLGLLARAGLPARRWSLVAAGLCFTAAVMTKQSFASAPLAAVLFLILTARRDAARLLLVMAGAGGLALAALALAVGPTTLWADLVTGNANSFSGSSLLRFEISFFRISAVVAGLSLFELGRRAVVGDEREARERLLYGLYALVSLLATASAGKAGAWENYFLEPFFALCVLAGRSLGRLARRGATATGRSIAAPILIALQLWLFLPGFERFGPAAEQRWLGELYEERTALASAVRAIPGERPILSEDLGVLVTAGRPVLMHTFVYSQLARQGDFDQAPLLAGIAARRFPLVVQRRGALEDRLDLDRWTEEMLEAIERAYTIEGTAGDWLLLRPAPDLRPVNLPLNAHLSLRGWAVEVNGQAVPAGPVAVEPGDRLRVHLLWERSACAGQDQEPCGASAAREQTFVHLLDWRDQRLAQSDGPPRLGTAVLTAPRRALIRETHALTVPLAAEPGVLPLLVGAYRLDSGGIEPLGPAQRLDGLKIEPATLLGAMEGPERSLPKPIALGPLALAAVSPLPASLRPGDTLAITVTWLARSWPETDLATFLHLVPAGTEGPPIAQQDQRPLGGRYPTTVWSAGERVAVPYRVSLPPSLPPGLYALRTGWYDPATGRRLVGADGDSIAVATVTVR